MDKYPKKFVGLHAHSTAGSLGDAIGLPQEHIDFAISNEMDALALTDHGTLCGVSHQKLHEEKLKKQGIKFKAISGIEAYFIDSLREWKDLYEESKKLKLAEKQKKKLPAQKEEEESSLLLNLGNEFSGVKEEIEEQVVELDEDEQGGTVVENETDTKTSKFLDPITQRSHLVLLPRNAEGLKAIYKLTSRSFKDGYFRYPRMDFEMLQEHTKGNVIALTACCGGVLARTIYKHQTGDWESWSVENETQEQFDAAQTELEKYAQKFIEALGGKQNFYLELQFNKLNAQTLVNKHLIALSKKMDLNLVVTADSHYSNPNHWKEREIYKAMAWASKTKGVVSLESLPKTIDELKCELYPKNASQIWKTYQEVKQDYDFYDDDVVLNAIERTHDIAHNEIEDIAIDKKIKLPATSTLIDKKEIDLLQEQFGGHLSDDDIAMKELVKLCIEAMRVKGKNNKPEYVSRLKHELEVIKQLNNQNYFLTYYKIMSLLSKELFTGTGRGSGAGSLVCYLLGITHPDPIKYGLLFERFLTKKKAGASDIDSDCADRDRAVKILIENFGENRVVPVTNFSQLQLRSLIKDIGRMYGIPFEEMNAYTSRIETEALSEAKKQEGFDRGVWVLTYEEAEKNSATFRKLLEEKPEFANTIKVLFKQMRSIGRHAGGVILTENASDDMPLIKSGGELQTPWAEGVNFRHLESFGFLKFDILGLGTLRMFEDCVRRILKKQGNPYPTFTQVKKWFDDRLHPDNNSYDDQEVYKTVYWNKKFVGIFQFVNPNSQNFISALKPTNIMDIAAATSIFRPGPLSLQVDQQYLENRQNSERIKYQHPLLKEILGPTQGLLVFQEQLQLIYHKLAGIPLEDTDSVRKTFTKKEISNKQKAEEERNKLRTNFIELCHTNNEIEEKVSGQIFDNMEKLVAYSFNLSHALCYAIISYQCAWFLTYFPDEWVATYIDYCSTSKGKVTGAEDPKAIAITEATSIGYSLLKPDINLSENEFIVKEGKKLIPSFSSLKHVGKTVVREIKDFRPYKTVENLLWTGALETWKHSKFNKRALSTLIKLEAFGSMDLVGPDKLFKNYRQMHIVLVDKGDDLKRVCSKKKNRNHKELLQQYIQEVQQEPDWTVEEKIKQTKELAGSVDLGLIVTPDVVDYLRKAQILSVDYFAGDENITESDDFYWAITTGSEIKMTKTGKPYLLLRLTGESGSEYRCFVWNYKEKTALPKYILVVGRFKKSDMGLSAFMNNIRRLDTESL